MEELFLVKKDSELFHNYVKISQNPSVKPLQPLEVNSTAGETHIN